MDGHWSAGRSKAIQSRRKTHNWNESHHSEILGRLHQSQRQQQYDHPEAHCGIKHRILRVPQVFGDPKTPASRASRSSMKTWYSTPCCWDTRFASSPKARWTNCKHMLTQWPHKRRGGDVGVLSKVTTTKTSVPSRWVRAQLELWTIESTLRYRLMRWFHSMASQQFHHDMMWAVLCRKCEWESVEGTDEHLQVAGCFQGFPAGWTAGC